MHIFSRLRVEINAATSAQRSQCSALNLCCVQAHSQHPCDACGGDGGRGTGGVKSGLICLSSFTLLPRHDALKLGKSFAKETNCSVSNLVCLLSLAPQAVLAAQIKTSRPLQTPAPRSPNLEQHSWPLPTRLRNRRARRMSLCGSSETAGFFFSFRCPQRKY